MKIREIKVTEYPLLEEFLYQAIFQRDLNNLLPKKVIFQPELYIYIKDFGEYPDDKCFVAVESDQVVGMVWVRIIDGFGSIDDTTPEFAISVLNEFRGQNIGTNLMKKMLVYLKDTKYSKTSLAVQKDNYAVKMYESVGFTIVDENNEEYIMMIEF